ncbi:MAG: alpha/beta hydrolase fold domain-containing protein [Planctomycetaceae bacterium]
MKVSAFVAALSGAFSIAVPVIQGADPPTHYPKLGVTETRETYKTVQQTKLQLHIFTCSRPDQVPVPAGRTAIVFFFGGGWKGGTTTQFKPHAQYFATRGVVAVTPEYRIRNVHQSTAIQSVSDAMSAIRWVRKNAQRLGIDPQKVIAAGGSAGGHLAAAAATLPDFHEPQAGSAVSCVPDGLLLFNPALDLRHEAFHLEEDSERYQDILSRLGTTPGKISPTLHVPEKAPPTIIFHGRDDPTVPFSQVTAFQTAWSKHGICEVKGYAGQTHGFFNFNRKNGYFRKTVEAADRFLVEHGFLEGAPTIQELEATVRSIKSHSP